MKALLRFNRLSYTTGHRYAFPLTAIFVCCCVAYLLRPMMAVDCLSMSVIFLFAISLLDGFFFCTMQSESMEHILIAKAGSARRYHLCTELFMTCLAFVYSALILLYPCMNSLLGTKLLSRTISIPEILFAAALLFCVSLCGYELGSLLHPRLTGFRSASAGLLLLIAAGCMARQALMLKYSFAKWIVWVFPPITDIVEISQKQGSFCGKEAYFLAFRFVLYALLAFVGKEFLLSHKK